MTPEFFIGQGNRLPTLDYQLLGPEVADGRGGKKRFPVDLTGCTVTFQMEGAEACCHGQVITGSATILDAKGGTVRYSWGANDTQRAGIYKATWTVTITATGLPMDVPNDGYFLIKIRPKIGG